MDEHALPDNEWVVVFYPTTGALRLHPTLEAAREHLAKLSWHLHIYRSPRDFKNRHDHFKLERFWQLIYKNVTWRFPKTAVGPVTESDAVPPDLPTEEFCERLWEFMQRAGDRVKGLSVRQTRSKDHYELRLDKMRGLISDQATFKTSYPKQARIIFERLAQEQSPYILEKDLEKLINMLVAQGKMKTKQPPWRIFQFYRPQFIKDGYIVRGNEGEDYGEEE